MTILEYARLKSLEIEEEVEEKEKEIEAIQILETT